MRIFVAFARAYPRQSLIALVCLVLAGLAEGIGISGLLPLLQMASRDADGPPAEPSSLEGIMLGVFTTLGIEPTMQTHLMMIMGALVLRAALTLIAGRQSGYAVAYMSNDLRLGLIRALLKARWTYYVHQPLGEVSNAIALEAMQASEAYSKATTIVAVAIQTTIYACAALLISWQATLVAVLAGGITARILNRLITMTGDAGIRQVRLSRALLSRLVDTLQAVKPIKAMARESLIQPILERETADLNRAIKHEVMSRATMEAVQDPITFALLTIGLYTAIALMELPLSSLAMLAFLAAQILNRFSKVQKEFQRLVARESAYWHVRETIEKAEAHAEVATGSEPPLLENEIRFEDVDFEYNEENQQIAGASFTIPTGEITVFMGPSGSGKTTLADLVIGLIEPTKGRVLIDGIDLRDIDRRSWRSKIGYVPQETLMLHDTIAHNVSLSDPEVSDDEIERALRDAGASGFMAMLPEGSATMVGERGLRVSGGQRQRLALARALVRRPRLLILDEATTALDPATEKEVAETLLQLRGGLTILAICHHGAIIDIADRIYRVQNREVRLVGGRKVAA
ncbi:MAG: ABC transporter ATP-binding protein [Candidatus Binatia bacterium]